MSFPVKYLHDREACDYITDYIWQKYLESGGKKARLEFTEELVLRIFIAVKEIFLHNFLQSIKEQAQLQPQRGLAKFASHLSTLFLMMMNVEDE